MNKKLAELFEEIKSDELRTLRGFKDLLTNMPGMFPDMGDDRIQESDIHEALDKAIEERQPTPVEKEPAKAVSRFDLIDED